MEWRTVIGFPDYMVDKIGRVKRIKRDGRNRQPKELKPCINGHGYLCYGLTAEFGGKAKTTPIHKIVIEAFLGPRPAWADGIDHINGDRLDNRIENLRYATAKEQTANGIRLWTHPASPHFLRSKN